MTTPAPAPNQVPGSFSIPATAPVYVDGLPVSAVSIQPPVSAASATQHFWSSPPRLMGDGHDETLIITLPSPQLINYISFDLPHFPHTAYVYWAPDAGSSDWSPVLTGNLTPLVLTVSGSVPAMVNPVSAMVAAVNPYHYGAGHWIHHDEKVTPFSAAIIIITGTRAYAGPGGYPVDPSGNQSPYPLGIRNLDFGYRALTRGDLPQTLRSASSVTERVPFAVSTDVLGSPLQLAVRENRASDLLLGSPWKSAPQPYPYSVVLLYADCRNAEGSAQVIDGVYFEPVTSGVSVTVYYSQEPPDLLAQGFDAVDTPLGFPVTSPGGSAAPSTGTDGILFPDAVAWLAIDNTAVQWNPAQPWWMSLEIMPQFASADAGTYAIADFGAFQILWNGGISCWEMTSSGGTMAAQPFPHAVNDRFCLTAAWDGGSLYFCAGSSIVSVATGSSMPEPGSFSIGSVSGENWAGNFRLHSMIIKQEFQDFLESDLLPAAVTDFISDSTSYLVPAIVPADDTGTTRNSLLRFCTEFFLGDPLGINPYGFTGGPGDIYDNVSWTPVCRDSKLASGTLRFDPVLASCMKFEFTSLLAETLDYEAPAPVTVRTFPSQSGTSYPVASPVVTAPSSSGLTPAQAQAAAASPPAPVPDTGLSVTQSVAPTISWPDSQPLTPPSAAGASLPTEALTAPGPATAEALARYGTLYQMQAWQQRQEAPSFAATGTHSYQYAQVTQRSRTAYYVAIQKILLSRENYAAQQDRARYTDLFLDTTAIDPATLEYGSGPSQPWDWSPGSLTVPYGLQDYAQVTSIIFPSGRNVTAVQFATQQSDPVQLLPDPDFQDPLLRSWAPVGDAAPLSIVAGPASTIGGMARVTRIPSQFSWTLLQDAYASWDAIEAAGLTWDDLIGAAQSIGYGGITSAGGVLTTEAGRVYAAARVFSSATLSFPLVLQVIDAQTGAVLAEETQDVLGGVPAEWYAGYTLSPGESVPSTWDEVMASYSTWESIGGTLWNDIDTTVQPPGSAVLARLVQYGISEDTWDVDTLSIYEDAIVWEFSCDGGNSFWPAYDIRNNPLGVLVLPPPEGPALSGGTQLMWRLSGYRPGLQVSSLAIRPWYGSLPGGVRPGIPVAGGPNMNILDHYPPIADDPRWKTWSSPVPQDWWLAFRQQVGLSLPPPVPVTAAPVLAFVTGHVISASIQSPDEGSEPSGPVTWSDIYAASYNGFYGAPDGGDIYTDEFGNNTYPLSDDPS